MYARVVSATIHPGRLDETIQLWRESVLPSVRQLKGFKGVRLLVDRENNNVVSMGLWETEADFLATVGWNQAQIDKFAELVAAPPDVGGYEVVIEV